MERNCPQFSNVPDECMHSNVLGQCVNVCHPDTASGYYPATNEAVAAMNEAGTNMCPEGMRPGRMVIKGLPATENTPEGYINTCGGKIVQEDMPDVNIVEWRYRVWFNLILAALVLIMLAGISVRTIKNAI